MSPTEPDILDSAEAGGRFIRGGGVRLVAYGGGLLVGLAATPFAVRHLGTTGWGHFVTVTSLLFIVASLTEGGLANLGVREFSTLDEAGRSDYMRSLLGLRIALSAVGAVAALGWALLAGYERVRVQGTAIGCVGLLVVNAQITLALPVTARMRLGWQATIDFVGQFATAVAMLALVIAGASVLWFFAVTIVTGLATLALTVSLVRGEVDMRPAFSLERWRAQLSDSIVYGAATALGLIYFRVVAIAVSLLTGHAQTGYFALAFRVIDLVNVVPWLLVTSAFPILARAARDDAERLRYGLQRLFEGGLILAGLISLALFVGAPFAVDVVGGAGFRASVTPVRVLAIGVPATFLVATWSFALLSLRRYRELIVSNALAVAVAVGLCLALIPAHGALGAAITTATLEAVLAAFYAVALMRDQPELRPSLARVPPIALALAVAFALALALPVHPILAVLAGGLLYAGVLQRLGALPAEIVQALRAGLLRRA